MVIFMFIAFIGILLILMPMYCIQTKREIEQKKGDDYY